MNCIGNFANAPIFLALAFASGSLSAAAQSPHSVEGDRAERHCRVAVSRAAAAGAFAIRHQSLPGGKCICRVTTGPRDQGGAAEAALAALLFRRSCDTAPLAAPSAGDSALLGLDADAVRHLEALPVENRPKGP